MIAGEIGDHLPVLWDELAMLSKNGSSPMLITYIQNESLYYYITPPLTVA